MTCGISNIFKDVTVWLIAHGEERTIFNKMRQGHFSRSGWELQVQGGQAQLVIKDTQDVHAGLYLWGLHGRQRYYSNVSLSVSGEARVVVRGGGRGRKPASGVCRRRMGTGGTGRRAEGRQRLWSFRGPQCVLRYGRGLHCPGARLEWAGSSWADTPIFPCHPQACHTSAVGMKLHPNFVFWKFPARSSDCLVQDTPTVPSTEITQRSRTVAAVTVSEPW